MKAPIPCVTYASKSSADDNDSISTQKAETALAIERAGGDRFEYLPPFFEEKTSGYKSDRGPELEAALVAVERAADEYGAAELWVWKSERLARGSGKKDEARSLLEVYTRCKRSGVVLRSVLDDAYVQDEAMIGMASKMANKYSADLSAAVQAGKRRQAERGDRLGGPIPDGLMKRDDGTIGRRPDREAIIDRLFDLSEEGHGDPTVARKLNAEGHRTRHGKPWTRRTVQHTILNPIYAGRIVVRTRDGVKLDPPEVVESAKVEAFIDPERYDRIVAAREKRDRRGPARSKRGGRPTTKYALARLAICDRCGNRMYSRTSPYRRKDGTKRRSYICANYHGSTGECTQKPLDAEAIDSAVVAFLDELFIDFRSWQSEVNGARDEQKRVAQEALDRIAAEVRKLDRRQSMVHEDYMERLEAGEKGAAGIAYESIEKLKAQIDRLTEQAKLHQQTIDQTAEPTQDSLLDAFNSLAQAVRGGDCDSDGEGLRDLNERLRANFDCFRLDQVDEETVGVLPVLKEEAGFDVGAAYTAWDDAGRREPTDEEAAEWDRLTFSGEPFWVTPDAKELLVQMGQYAHE